MQSTLLIALLVALFSLVASDDVPAIGNAPAAAFSPESTEVVKADVQEIGNGPAHEHANNLTEKWTFTVCQLFPTTDCSGGYYYLQHGYCYPCSVVGNGYFAASVKGFSNGDIVRYATSAACKTSAIDMKYYGFTAYQCYSIGTAIDGITMLSIKCS